MKTRWRAQSQRSHSVGPTPRTKQEDSGQQSRTITTNIQKHCIRRRPESGVMPHGTAQHWTITSYLFRHSVHVTCTCIEATVLSTRLTSCKPYDLRKRTCPKLTSSLSQLSLHSILLSSFVLFVFLYCADILCKCNTQAQFTQFLQTAAIAGFSL